MKMHHRVNSFNRESYRYRRSLCKRKWRQHGEKGGEKEESADRDKKQLKQNIIIVGELQTPVNKSRDGDNITNLILLK